MRGGDISNTVTPRIWFVWEGLVGIEIKPVPNRVRKHYQAVHDCYVTNPIVIKRASDLASRFDMQPHVVTFLGDSEESRSLWGSAIQRVLDEQDAPLTVFAMDFSNFVHEIVPSPGVYRVFDSDYARVGEIGGKATLVDPSVDFDPTI